jgi:hypothetical protein
MNDTSEMRATWNGDISGEPTIEAPSVNRRRILRVWAGLILALTLVNLSLAVWYAVATRDATGFLSHQLLTPVAAIIYTLLGVLVISRRPRNSIGWLFLATGTSFALSAMAAGIKVYGTALPATLSPALLDTALWLDNYIWLPAQILPTTFVFLLFPDGRLLSRRWRLVAWMNGLGLALVMAGSGLASRTDCRLGNTRESPGSGRDRGIFRRSSQPGLDPAGRWRIGFYSVRHPAFTPLAGN